MKIYLLTGASVLTLSACASEPTALPIVTAQHAVANPAVSSSITYKDPLSGYVYRGPTGPRDWRSVNQEQTESH